MVDPRVHKEARTLVENGHEVAVLVWDRQNEHKPTAVIDEIKLKLQAKYQKTQKLL